MAVDLDTAGSRLAKAHTAFKQEKLKHAQLQIKLKRKLPESASWLKARREYLDASKAFDVAWRQHNGAEV